MSLEIVGKVPPQLQASQPQLSSDAVLPDSQPRLGSSYDLRTLRHLLLDDDPTFSELKKRLEDYLEDMKLPPHKQQVLPYKSTDMREVLFSSLIVLLSEVTFTHDRAQQQRLLARIKKWYDEKTIPPGILPPVIRRKDLSRPNSRRLSRSETPLRQKKAIFELKRLDANPTIESRSPSPTKTPVLPRLVISHNAQQGSNGSKANASVMSAKPKIKARSPEVRLQELLGMKAATARNSNI
jgi:hypothetical protein